MTATVIPVRLGERSYEVRYIGKAADITAALQPVKGKEFALVDAKVDRLHGKAFRKALPRVEFIKIPSGEGSKSFLALEKTANQLVRHGATRHSRLYAIGGGVVGDLTGFLAGVFMRGIPFVQVPTTLLAMVDSSVGGKTAVNIAAGKNLVGVFHQPQAVFILPALLKTLPVRELRCGLSESIKTALIADAGLVATLERRPYEERKTDIDYLAEISAASIRIKADIVSKDEKEQNIRAFLNFGHTLAHAIEAKTGFRGILHGEAVAIGQRFAALLSRRVAGLSAADETRIGDLLRKYRLPATLKTPFPKSVKVNELVRLMRADKKNMSGDIRFVLLRGIGACELPRPVPETELLASLKEFQTLGG
ncbi:MAG: 3-dehydroquinate synthase [Turneriella sp.]|nr:3-dehydroquinate synthase [Turneriella sp.]